jgi:cell division protein FtsQ
MTTLHVDRQRLEETAAGYPIVASIEVEPDFPNGLRIHVIEHRPVALLDAGGRTVPVAGDGSVLASLRVDGDLPTIELSGALPARRLPPGAALDAARVAGAAPPAIVRRLESVGREGGARGVVAQIADGPEIVFGAATRVDAKWAATLRVLADEESAGASYLDVRIPERPVAGGLAVETVAPVAPVGADPSIPTDPTIADPVETPSDPALAVPETATPTPAPETAAPVAPTAPQDAGGLTVNPQP